MRAIVLAVASLISLAFINTCSTSNDGSIRITLLHTNDVHARLSQIDAHDQLCKDDDIEQGRCFGGVARRFAKIAEIRKNYPNVLLLDAGDEFQGTLFFAKYHGDEARYFMNLMGYDAMAVGNHEFDNGPAVLGQFAAGAQFPLVSSNINVKSEASLTDLIKPYATVQIDGQTVGIVGFTTEDTANISSSGPTVQFLPIESSVQQAVDALRAKGINIIFAVSHSGYARDMEVASRVNGISVIVSGHTNTLLSNVDKKAEGPYPTVVRAPNGEPVLIVSAYAYGKYLGFLEAEFNQVGRLTKWQGEPILLDASVPEDEVIAKKVMELREPLEALRREVVAEIPEMLEGTLTKCRHEECSLGNAVADAIFAVAQPYGAELALMNSGGIRTSLDAGKVTRWNIKDALPFGNPIVVATLTGQEIIELLEYGVAGNQDGKIDQTAKFPQVSHARYVWGKGAKQGKQIRSVELLDDKGCYRPIDVHQSYRVATNRFVFNGGDGYGPYFAQAKQTEHLSETLDEALISWLKNSEVATGNKEEWRVRRID